MWGMKLNNMKGGLFRGGGWVFELVNGLFNLLCGDLRGCFGLVMEGNG